MTRSYDHKKIEKKWQERWQRTGIYTPDIKRAKNPFYNLWMFPYPSGEGLHAGHAFASTGSDIYGRFQRMNQKDVFQPIGYDSFGIHSENFAIKIGQTPQEMLSRTTKHYEKQLKSLGHGYDWKRTVTTSDVSYYKWTQWLFVKLFDAGLAYRKKANVNWCPSCKTVLADEQVINGQCERCDSEVVSKELEQWFFRITDYAERLLLNLEKIDWPLKIKTIQKNWIGKSEGMLIKFKEKNSGSFIEVFTTRPDTLNAATFIATSKLYKKNKIEKEKRGIFTGRYFINPLNGKELPLWDTNYVTPDYGTGVIMGVPAHDERDMDFAKKYSLDIVYQDPDPSLWTKIEERGWGKRYTSYHLRDWLISRQRYWGPPIPMIYCKYCASRGKSWFSNNIPKIRKNQSDWNVAGWYPDLNLPVKLPFITDYKPEGKGKGPLAKIPSFYKVLCPACGKEAQRETDVSDTFLDSSWYFLRYPSVGLENSDRLPFDPEITKKWLPVNLYFGGAEHAVLHLLYSRFISMVLFDLGYIHFEEPFPKFFAHGLVIKDGAKMSKSRGNVVNPDEYIEKFGADALRLYLMFMGPIDGFPDFRDEGMEGMARFVKRVWRLFVEYKDFVLEKEQDVKEVMFRMHHTIKKVTEDIQKFRYNTAIASIMEFVNLLYDKVKKGVKIQRKNKDLKCAQWQEALKTLCLLIAPFAPHLAEEVWVEILGEKYSVHKTKWPSFNLSFVSERTITIPVQVNGKLRGTLKVAYEKADDEKYVSDLARNLENVSRWLKRGKIKKIVFLPKKLINFVVI